MQFCNRRQMCSTCAVSCHGSMWVSLAEDTMLCTRPRTVVMQCCVRGCRSPSGKTWKTWSVFVFYVFYVVYVVYLLVYDLLDPCLVCSIFFQENADLDPHQKDVRHRSLVSWVLRKESKTPNRTLHKLFKSWRGQTCAALAKKAGFEDEGKAWWTIWLQDVSSCYFVQDLSCQLSFQNRQPHKLKKNTKID